MPPSPLPWGNPFLLPTPSSGCWGWREAVGHPSVLVQGLGLVVTGTLPVFNLTEDSSDRKVGDWLPPWWLHWDPWLWGHSGVGRVPQCWVHG